jgi:hypothetical protein
VVFSSLLPLPPSWVQIFSSAPCSQTPSIYVLTVVRDKVPHRYKTAGKIIVLHISILRFCRTEGFLPIAICIKCSWLFASLHWLH